MFGFVLGRSFWWVFNFITIITIINYYYFSLGNSPTEAEEILSFGKGPVKQGQCPLKSKERLMQTEDVSN